ncbi:MAG TPA: FecR family protein [Puia sp.]|nr:FecR family protein [Puia sp.]
MKDSTDPLEDRFWLLVSLKLAGEATPDDLTELTSLLRDHPEWSLRVELFTNIWRQNRQNAAAASQPGEAQNVGAASFNRHLQRLSTHLANPVLQYENPAPRAKLRSIGKIRQTASIAAALIGAILLVAIYQHRSQNAAQGYNTVSTRAGSRSKLQLPDGTLVWLNADSRLTYKIDDQNPNREVTLTGEAYFDVARDKNHPFLIHTATIDIRVLGTCFNVQCYGNDKHTETSLFQGSVEITLKNNPGKKIILQPSEKLIVQNNEVAVTNIKTKEADADEPLMTLGKVHYQVKDSSYIETLWTKNKLAFDDRSLEDIAHQIERWYGARVTITDDKLKTARFTAVFEDESLDQIMQALRMTGDFHYSIHKKEVTITP